jgi:hypothetical protein
MVIFHLQLRPVKRMWAGNTKNNDFINTAILDRNAWFLMIFLDHTLTTTALPTGQPPGWNRVRANRIPALKIPEAPTHRPD